MAAIDNIYAYYLTTYGQRTSSKYDAHKKSELRNVYNRIIKLNKDTPLYKLKNEGQVARFAIDIKEGAQHMRNVIASISGSDDIMKALQKKIASSSQEDIVKARYVGKDDDNEHTEDFQIEVQKLAKPQINIGSFIKSSQRSLPPDTYSFDLTNTVSGYEFQFTVAPDDTNYTVQTKLANLITNAGIGLTASVIEDHSGLSALKVESLHTGLEEDQEFLFRISAGGSANSVPAIEVLGIDQVSQEAENSSFLLNGTAHSSYSNTFTINQAFELQLVGISQEGQPATIGFKPNTQSILENIKDLTDAYNSMLDTSDKYEASQKQSQRLRQQIAGAAVSHQEDLAAIGLMKEDDGHLSVNTSALTSAIESEHPSQQLSVLNDFKKSLDDRAALATLNPMAYVNKIIVAYKNPGKTFPAPYATSIYSGMMMDRFC